METLLTCLWLPVWFLQSVLIKALGGILFLSRGGTPEVSLQSSFGTGLLYSFLFGLLLVNILLGWLGLPVASRRFSTRIVNDHFLLWRYTLPL